MTKLWATIIETTTRDVQLEAPDDMTLDELKDLAAEGELLDTCTVIDETPEEDNEETKMYIYNFDGKPVEHKEEKDNNNYDAGHAEEWMERHPHGYYNSEKDYGEDTDDDKEE